MARKVAIVTGTAQGIGRAIATALARNDHDLAIGDSRQGQLAEIVEAIECPYAAVY